jgi:hypothetical protein
VPAQNAKRLEDASGLELIPVDRLQAAIAAL